MALKTHPRNENDQNDFDHNDRDDHTNDDTPMATIRFTTMTMAANTIRVTISNYSSP